MAQRSLRYWLARVLPVVGLVLLFQFTNPVPQDSAYYVFADGRAIWSVPNFWNVLSNLPFLLIGLWGLHVVTKLATAKADFDLRNAYLVFFAGVLLTAAGSGYFHLEPGDGTLFWDRLPMTIAFAGLFAAVIGEYGSTTTARRLLPVFLIIGIGSVVYWQWTESIDAGDLRPYAIVQFLPMLAIPAILLTSKRRNDIGRYIWLMTGFYVVAKLFEYFDRGIFEALQVMSGHTLKHVVAAAAPAVLALGLNRRLPGPPDGRRSPACRKIRAMATATRIDGKAKAAELSAAITAETAELMEKHGLQPGLAVVIVGEDSASQVYVRNKKRTAEACGFRSDQHTLAKNTSQDQVLELIDKLNNDNAVHGILVQLPLPGHLDAHVITQSISPAKDVDGFHYLNIGKLTAGDTADAFVPCTPAGCMRMIEDYLGSDLSGKSAVVIGRSNIVGKPMASLLLAANATVTVTHSRTKDLPGVVRGADIVIAAVGRPNIVRGDWIKPGAIVIDVGINRIDVEIDGETRSKLTGDVNYDEAMEVAAAVTPVPGGVGPMTIAMLMSNTLHAAKLSAAIGSS